MTTSPYLCPLNCGWHHDQADPTFNSSLPNLPLPTPDLAYVLSLGHLHGVEAILRAHLETHELIEWVQALQAAKQLLAKEKAEQEAYEESVVGSLNERNIRDCGRADKAEAQVARIRAFLEDMAGWCSPHGVAADYSRRGLDALDGVDPLGLAGPTREPQAEDAPRQFMAGDFLRAPKTGETPTLSSEFDADIELPNAQASDLDPTPGERQQEAFAPVHDTGTDHWGGRWAWRCDGHQHCAGDISLGHLTQEAAVGSYLRHVDECHGTEPTERQLHRRMVCPGWEYATTEGPRKQWDDADRPPEGDGWERNVDAGRDGWDRFDYTEESYWRRRTPAGEQR